MTSPAARTRIVQMALVNLLVREIQAGGDAIETFIEIDRRFPGLTFNDFTAHALLAASIAMQPEGRA
jgi:hypothetical protein